MEEFEKITNEFRERMNAIGYPVIVIIAADRKTGQGHLFYDESLEGKAIALYYMGELAKEIDFTEEEKKRLENGVTPAI